ncbi:MAG: NPCBM/NEW2 domain-containing protein [Candidatus Poribacteria bacterium]|nr:NPCBM/NEW2 domain-containing protein [Candidatus Poribacteria bacterium]
MKLKFNWLAIILFTICAYSTQAEFITKVVYFKPADVKIDLTARIQEIVENTQETYANEMQRNGFGRKTFRVETHLDKPRIHTVNGTKNASAYLRNTHENTRNELPNTLRQDTPPFSKQDTIIVIVVGGIDCIDGRNANSFCAWGVGYPHHSSRYGGGVLIAADSGNLNEDVLFHEMGHAFGLYHKPQNSPPSTLEMYEARWLDKHYHFNSQQNNFVLPEFVDEPKITALENNKFKLKIKAFSNIGLHQAMLVNANILVNSSDYMQGENENTVSLEFNRLQRTTNMFIELMDINGNYIAKDFAIELPNRLSPELNIATENSNFVYLTLVDGDQPVPNDVGLNPSNSKLEWTHWGEIRDNLTTNGQNIVIGGTEFTRGISVVPGENQPSILIYDLTALNYIAFSGYIGLADEADFNIGINANASCDVGGSATFTFEIDEQEIYYSDTVDGTDEPIHVEFAIPANSKELKITITDARDTNWCDGASIGDAKLIRSKSTLSNNTVQSDSINADVNNDGSIDLTDVNLVKQAIKTSTDYDTDVNNDGVTNEIDLLIVKAKAHQAIAAAAPRKTKIKLTSWAELKREIK